MHRDEAVKAHQRLRSDLTLRSDRCNEYEESTNIRLRELEQEMYRVIQDQRNTKVLSAQKAALIGSVIPSIVGALVALIIHFWK